MSCEYKLVLIQNNQEILQDRADFALQEQLEDNLMVAVYLCYSQIKYRAQLEHCLWAISS